MKEARRLSIAAPVFLTLLMSLTFVSLADAPAFSVTGLWESKYVSEGRDNLEDGGLFTIEGVAKWRGTTLGVWLAAGDSESYQELNASIQYEFSAGPVEAYFGYTRLAFLKDDESDNEISAGIGVDVLPGVTPGIDYTYSTEADGGFLEISLRSKIKFLEERCTIEPYVLEGFDFGYASEEYNGANHLQVGFDISLAVTDQVSMVGSVAHSWAHQDVENEGLGDESWVTVGLSADF